MFFLLNWGKFRRAFRLIEMISRKIDILFNEISRLHQRISRLEKSMYALNELKEQVRANKDVVASAVALILGLKAQLEAAGTDSAALAEIKDSLAADAEALAAAVAANTKAEEPAVEPAVEPVAEEAPAEVPADEQPSGEQY